MTERYADDKMNMEDRTVRFHQKAEQPVAQKPEALAPLPTQPLAREAVLRQGGVMNVGHDVVMRPPVVAATVITPEPEKQVPPTGEPEVEKKPSRPLLELEQPHDILLKHPWRASPPPEKKD